MITSQSVNLLLSIQHSITPINQITITQTYNHTSLTCCSVYQRQMCVCTSHNDHITSVGQFVMVSTTVSYIIKSNHIYITAQSYTHPLLPKPQSRSQSSHHIGQSASLSWSTQQSVTPSHHITSHHITSHHITSHHITSHKQYIHYTHT